MLRTFNYTGRKTLETSEASFQLFLPADGNPYFSAELCLQKGKYPGEASVYIRAYHKETSQRFYFGTVDNIIPPHTLALNEVESTENVRFEILVVDETKQNALILGSGNFQSTYEGEDQSRRKGLIVVKPSSDLGSSPWEIEFDNKDLRPTLLVNKMISDPVYRMKSDPVFQALILPSVMRIIIQKLFFTDDVDDDGEVYRKWLAFVSMFDERDPMNLVTDDEREEWENRVVREFCARFDLTTKLSLALHGDP